MGRKFYGFNNRFRTTKNTEAIYKYRTNTGKMTASFCL